MNRVGLIGYKVFLYLRNIPVLAIIKVPFQLNLLCYPVLCIQFSAEDRLAAVFVVGFSSAGIFLNVTLSSTVILSVAIMIITSTNFAADIIMI